MADHPTTEEAVIETHYFLIVTALLTVGTIIIRGFFISLTGRFAIPTKIKELFTFIPASILPALIIPATYFHQGQVSWVGGKERFVVLLVTCLACYFYRNTLFVISFGLSLLYLATQMSP